MRSNLVRWLVLAGVIHITLTLAIFLAGHFELLPQTIDTNGTGLSFAVDALSYRSLASRMVAHWQTNGFADWLAVKAPLHCRLYSITFALFGWLLGHNILAAEPLNLFYYLAILSCVYLLGREIFSPQAALIAAIITGLWPSLLLHSTQLVRDPLSILCLLALLLVLTLLLSRRQLSWRATAIAAVSGAVFVTLFWVARGNMWNVIVITVIFTIALLCLRTIRERRFLGRQLLVLAAISITMLFVPARLESTTLYGIRPPVTPLAIPTDTQQRTSNESIFMQIGRQIVARRSGFRSYFSRASDIDSDVRLTTFGDLLRFFPRALEIGFLAPFPRMWVERGSFGLAGRLLSGAEMLAMYLLYAAAALSVWRHRRSLEMWLLFLTAAAAIFALGLVVVNAGALYRLRYAFWIMLIVVAADTLAHFTVLRTRSTNSRMSSSVVSNEHMNRHSEVSSFHT